jgi:hypothetical protein
MNKLYFVCFALLSFQTGYSKQYNFDQRQGFGDKNFYRDNFPSSSGREYYTAGSRFTHKARQILFNSNTSYEMKNKGLTSFQEFFKHVRQEKRDNYKLCFKIYEELLEIMKEYECAFEDWDDIYINLEKAMLYYQTDDNR